MAKPSAFEKSLTLNDIEYHISVTPDKDGFSMIVKDLDRLQTYSTPESVPSSKVLQAEIVSAIERKHQRKFELNPAKGGVEFVFVVEDPFRPVRESIFLKKAERDKKEELMERIERLEIKLKKAEAKLDSYVKMQEQRRLDEEKRAAEEKELVEKYGLAGLHLNTLSDWLGKKFQDNAKLLYRGTRDGFSNAKFHAQCDNKGSIVIFVQVAGGYVFGGYTAVGWSQGNGNYVRDDKAFLFSLKFADNVRESKHALYQNHQYAIYPYVSTGPTFGSGHDLSVNLDSLTSSYSNLGAAYSPPPGFAYNSQQAKSYFAGMYNNWQIKEVEVYSI